MRYRFLTAGVVATAGLAGSLVLGETSCGQTPTNVAVRTFQGAQRMDVLCVQVLGTTPDDAGAVIPIPAIPVSLDHCAPVATGVDPTTLTFHTLAVVTQTTRGELAVVDLTLGKVIDTSLALPGINFLPVGQNPTDVVVTPDVQTVFVAAAETDKPAIYAIPSTQLLGDSANLDETVDGSPQSSEQVSITSWPACGLPQAPGRMVVVPTSVVAGDAGDAGDGGVTQGFEIVVVMPGNGFDQPALVGLIDTAPFTDGTIAPGSLTPCPIKSIIQLAESSSALPKAWTPGPNWPLGLPYVDGGIDLFATTGSGGAVPSSNNQLPLWSCPGLLHPPGAEAGAPDASAVTLTPGQQVHGAGVVTDGRFVWVGDQAMPFVHVLDTQQTPGALTELAPLLATSVLDPSRVVTTSELAISPVTRDYKRYLYAVDAFQGSLLLYDVTDPANGPRMPLTRPNPELDPLQSPDRILLSSPVATIAFAYHDFPIPPSSQTGPAATGLLCNPNPNAGDVSQTNPADPGVFYRDNGPITLALGPTRLRGVFAFATMTTGQVAIIDVDDWDSPCRRPAYLAAAPMGSGMTGSLAVPEPNPSSGSDLDPYHAPDAGAVSASIDGGLTQWVTDEPFWPVIQPHRLRSSDLEEDDLTGTGGLHAPELTTTPTLLITGAPVALTGQPYALISAALPEFYNPSCLTANPQTCTVLPSPVTVPNVFMAHDIPDVHVDQTWNVVYEGVLPNFANIPAAVSSTDGFLSLTFQSSTAFFCGNGVEDHNLGLQRFAAMQADDTASMKPSDTPSYIPMFFDQRVGDYVQITDDIIGTVDASQGTPAIVPPTLPIDDPYWNENPSCWAGITTTGATPIDLTTATSSSDDPVALARQQTCVDKFGALGADENPQRDFPILAAFEDHLVLGRYAYLDPVNRPTNGRVIVPPDTTPQVDFELAQCCFHSQAHFAIRTGAEWVALGSVTPYLHHVVADANGACVQSCDPRVALLNARTPELNVGSIASTALTGATQPTRNSPFAVRNPAFSFFMPAPVVTGTAAQTLFSVSARDNTWQFATRGQYNIEGISLVGANTSVVPKSSMFVAPLGALAVVDGSAEGLFIIDLNTLSIADGSPFF